MAKKMVVSDLGKLYKRVPKGCKCPRDQKAILVGKYGVRCMGWRRYKGLVRWLFDKTPKPCNK